MTKGLVSVATAGAWWNGLTYIDERPAATKLEPGVRVRVPMGSSSRVGVVVGDGEEFSGEVKPIVEVIDERPICGDRAVYVLRWFCDAYMCGMGTALKTLLPARFMRGDALPAASAPAAETSGARGGVAFIYEPNDERRSAGYARMIADGSPTLVCCPTRGDAATMFDGLRASSDLPDEIKERMMLYPNTTPAAEWKAWGRISSGEPLVVVGSHVSAMAPMPGLARVIVDDESSSVWRTMRAPIYNVRSLLATRARAIGASLVLGGRMPSSRAYMHLEREGLTRTQDQSRSPEKKIFFVDMREAYKPAIKDVEGGLAVSEPLVRETRRAIESGSWALWVLDRKGYAAEIRCQECGSSIVCDVCGGLMRWEASRGRMRCVVCGADRDVPESCPHCRGRLLTAKRAGVEAALPLARYALDGEEVMLYDGEVDASSRPGLVVGTRAVLDELTRLRVGLVAWLDADGEARRDEFDARARAFGLIWESMWRGLDPDRRSVLLQTRRPSRGWQSGLRDTSRGWRTFWRMELEERRELSMPPFTSLVRAELARSDLETVTCELDARAYEYWIEDEGPRSVIWIRTNRSLELRRILAPLFHISRASRGFPQITVRHS